MTKTRKRHKIISLQFLHSIGSGLSGRFPLLLRWRRKTIWEKKRSRLKKIYYLCVCIYMNLYTHTYISIISGWSGVSFTFWSGKTSLRNSYRTRRQCFLLLESSSPQLCPQLKLKACSTSLFIWCEWYFTHWEGSSRSSRWKEEE